MGQMEKAKDACISAGTDRAVERGAEEGGGIHVGDGCGRGCGDAGDLVVESEGGVRRELERERRLPGEYLVDEEGFQDDSPCAKCKRFERCGVEETACRGFAGYVWTGLRRRPGKATRAVYEKIFGRRAASGKRGKLKAVAVKRDARMDAALLNASEAEARRGGLEVRRKGRPARRARVKRLPASWAV